MDFLSRINRKNFILLSILVTFAKGFVNVKFEDVNVEFVNDEYIDEDTFDLSVNYINETYNTLRCKVVVINDFPRNLEISFGMYAYAFGDFRLHMPFDLHFSTCDIKSRPMLMAPFITAIGGDLNKCIPDKGEYGNESFYPVDTSKLANVFPRNKYRLDVQISNEEIVIVKVQFFVEVTNIN